MRCCLLLAGLSRLSRAYAQDDCHAGELQLLQRKLDLETSVASSTEPLVLPQLRAAEPVKWLHIPKCGTSFLNALIHLPSVCPGVNASYRVDDKVLGKHFEEEFFRECPEVCNTSKFNCDYGHHEGIGTSYEMELKGHLVTMLREPKQRILSAFHDPVWTHGVAGESAASYAEKQRGGMTCQVMRDGDMDPPPKECHELTEADARLAAVRLREGFAFVGITDEWDLSICLLHRIFGSVHMYVVRGDCLLSDFEDNRPSVEGAKHYHIYNILELEGYEDPVDRILYNEAKQIFFEKRLAYNVTMESCQPCFQSANHIFRPLSVDGIEKGYAGRPDVRLILAESRVANIPSSQEFLEI